MAVSQMFMTSTDPESPLDGSKQAAGGNQVSEFLSLQSLTNFGAMTGGILAAWKGLQLLLPNMDSRWVPFSFVVLFAVFSLAASWRGLKKDNKFNFGNVVGAILVGAINSLVLFGAIIAASGEIAPPGG